MTIYRDIKSVLDDNMGFSLMLNRTIIRFAAVAGPKTEHIPEISLYFEFPVLTLTAYGEPSRTMSGLRPWES